MTVIDTHPNWGIGGSDVAALVGLHPYKTAADVYARIVHKADNGPKAKVILSMGKHMEPHLIDSWCKGQDIAPETIKRNVEIIHPTLKFARGELDGIDESREYGVEAKCVFGPVAGTRWGPDGSDEIPEEYLCQCAWYCMLAGVPLMHIIALVWGEPRNFIYERNLEFEAALVDAAQKFWTDHIEKEVPPDLLGASTATLLSIFPNSSGNLRKATEEETELIADLKAAKAALKAADYEEAKAKARLQAVIREDVGLQSALGKVTWKKSKDRKITDWKGLAEELGASEETIDEHSYEKAGNRPLCFYPKKEK